MPVTRPRLWQEEHVLGAAMNLFHAKGFEATSLRDVERATGLHTGSLYQAYGSKAGVFEAVLAAYNERVVAARIERHLASAPDAVSGLVAFFASTYEDRPVPDPGCLVTNSAIEAPHLSDAARGVVAAGLDAIRRAFVEVLERSDARGADYGRIEELADQLLALYQGLLVLVRFGQPRETLARVTAAVEALAAGTTDPSAPRRRRPRSASPPPPPKEQPT